MIAPALRIAALLLVAASLGGCVSAGERRAQDDARCRSYGFRPGTDGFAGCLQTIDLDRSADRRELLGGPTYGYGYGAVGYRRGWW